MVIPERLYREMGREYAIRVLKQNIISWELLPGTMLSENEIASALGLSRTPVREAFIELSKNKLLEILPQRGSCVTLVDLNLASDAMFIRCALESAVIRDLCKSEKELDWSALEHSIQLQNECLENQFSIAAWINLDNEFHRLLFELSNRMFVYDIMSQATIHLDRVRNTQRDSGEFDSVNLSEHEEILQKLKTHDDSNIEALLLRHVNKFQRRDTFPLHNHEYYVQFNASKNGAEK